MKQIRRACLGTVPQLRVRGADVGGVECALDRGSYTGRNMGGTLHPESDPLAPCRANRTHHADVPVGDNVVAENFAVGLNLCDQRTSKSKLSKTGQGATPAGQAELRPAPPAGTGASRSAPPTRSKSVVDAWRLRGGGCSPQVPVNGCRTPAFRVRWHQMSSTGKVNRSCGPG